jgi:hypothetical protein
MKNCVFNHEKGDLNIKNGDLTVAHRGFNMI